MASRISKLEWLLLIHQLPPAPSNLRVRVWRKLQRLGAVSLKGAIYILPATEKTREDFEWLKQEIVAAGGEASVFRADAVEGATDEEIIKAFRQARDEEYSRLADEFNALTESVAEQRRDGKAQAMLSGNFDAELAKVHGELERISSIDFFTAPQRKTAQAAYERCRRTLLAIRPNGDKESKRQKADGILDRKLYQGKRWITRPHIHIDRVASGWLIKRFVDSRPRFYFAPESDRIKGAIPFDMFGVEFGHHGEDCTFETLVKRFGLAGDAALRQIAEIVHDIDLKDGKFNRTEAAGLDATVRGLAKAFKDDRKLLMQGISIFDGLYAFFTRREDERVKGKSDGSSKGRKENSGSERRAKRRR